MTIETGHRYYIVNKKSNTVMDLDTRNHKTVQCWSRHTGANQQWDFTQVENGWHIRNASQGTYLAFDGGAHDGQRIICTRQPYVWHIWPADGDESAHKFCVPNSKQTIDLSDHGNIADGTTVHLWTGAGTSNQAWFAQRVQ